MTFRADATIAIDALDEFAARAHRREGPVIRQPGLADLHRQLDLERLIASGGLEGEALQRFLETYLAASTRLQHPACMAHQVAVPLPHSAIAALIDGFMNNAMAIYEMGPAAATVENAVLDWMLGKVGWPISSLSGSSSATARGAVHGGGVLTHGGSLANLTALIAARGRIAPKAFEQGSPAGLVIVCSPNSHYSVARAAGIMGLGQKAIRHAPTDRLGRIDASRLAGFLATLDDEGARPLAVVANACGTALGLYDPLRAIAGVCRERGVWLHVDGAHGASALVSARLRHLLDGIELADSVIWDAHKMLRTSVLSAAVLVRDARDLDHAFREDASYLFHEKDEPGFDFVHRTVECTKAALGLKVFFALAHAGEHAIAAGIERQTDLAQAAAAYLSSEPGITVAVEPQTNIVCFRFEGSDHLQIELRRRLTEDGDYYISTTEALGQRWLRLALMNPATEMADIEGLIARLRQHLAELGQSEQ